MKGKKKWFIIVGAVVLAGSGGAYFHAKSKPVGPVGIPVMTTQVMQKTIEQSLTLRAPLEGSESTEVVSRLHNEILQIHVKEGDVVTKGQLLATLDSEKLQDEIKVLQDSLELTQLNLNKKIADADESYQLEKVRLDAKIKEQQKEYDKVVQNIEEEKRQFEITKSLSDQGVLPAEDARKQEAAIAQLQKDLDKYTTVNGQVVPEESDLKEIEASKQGMSIVNGKAVASAGDYKTIEIARRAVEQKRKDLEECQMKSNINGAVTRVHGKVGRFADDIDDDKSLPMFVIEDMSKLQMTVSVSEYDIGKLQLGQTAVISADILENETVSGVITRISPTGEEKTNSSGTTERVIPTQIEVTSSNPKLIAGITATAKIEIAKAEDTLVIPIDAVVQQEDGSYMVYVVDENQKVSIRPVTVGLENDLEMQVLDGLQVEDVVIVSPDLTLQEGSDVVPSDSGAAMMG